MATETIVPAKPDQRIWVLGAQFSKEFDLIDVIAWAVTPSGPPIPITVAGRLAQGAEYVLGCETGFMLLPSGHAFRDSCEVGHFLRSRRAAA
jgi:hypothetical protein